MAEVVGKRWCIQAEVEMKLCKTYYSRQLAGFVKELKKYQGQKMGDELYHYEDAKKRREAKVKSEVH
jgi:hypothetical protein